MVVFVSWLITAGSNECYYLGQFYNPTMLFIMYNMISVLVLQLTEDLKIFSKMIYIFLIYKEEHWLA